MVGLFQLLNCCTSIGVPSNRCVSWFKPKNVCKRSGLTIKGIRLKAADKANYKIHWEPQTTGKLFTFSK